MRHTTSRLTRAIMAAFIVLLAIITGALAGCEAARTIADLAPCAIHNAECN